MYRYRYCIRDPTQVQYARPVIQYVGTYRYLSIVQHLALGSTTQPVAFCMAEQRPTTAPNMADTYGGGMMPILVWMLNGPIPSLLSKRCNIFD